MDISLQTGSGLKCPYTGQETDVLVTLKGDGQEAAKLSEEALNKALALVRSYKVMSGNPQAAMAAHAPLARNEHVNHVPQMGPVAPPVAPVVHAPLPQQPMGSDNPKLIENFDRELVQLLQNPPDDGQGKQGGLAEVHIRELIKKFKGAFLDPRNMFGPLNARLGIPKERFDILLAAN